MMLKFWLAFALIRTHRYREVPMLTLYAGLGCVMTFCMWGARMIWDTGYYDVWMATRPLALSLETVIAVEGFWVLLGKVPGFRGVGIVVTAIFVAVSAAAAWVSSNAATGEWTESIRNAVLMARQVAIGGGFFIALSAAWAYQYPQRYITARAQKHVRVLAVLFGCSFISSAIVNASNGYFYRAMQLLNVAAPAACSIVWIRMARRPMPRSVEMPRDLDIAA